MHDHAIEILLIEDNPDDEELTMLALEEHHLSNRIKVLRDGAEAMDYLSQCCNSAAENAACLKLKLIMLDLKLPKVSGLEILKFLKANPDTRAIPVVVLTSSREDRDIIESYDLGVNSYIIKPVTFEQLVQSIRQIGMYWVLLNQPPAANH